MGADFITACLVQDKDATLNWDAVDATVNSLPEHLLVGGLEAAYGEVPESNDEAREQVRELFTELRDLFEGDTPRDVGHLEVRGAVVILSGGMSWGDEPTETFTLLSNVGYFPEVLAAVGFESDDTNAVRLRLDTHE